MARSRADRRPVEHGSGTRWSAGRGLAFACGAAARNGRHTIVRSLTRTHRWRPRSLSYVKEMARTVAATMAEGCARTGAQSRVSD